MSCKSNFVCLLMLILFINSNAQVKEHSLFNGLNINIESSTVVSNGNFAPLWLSSNRYGLTSVEPNSNYERISLFRSNELDSLKIW